MEIPQKRIVDCFRFKIKAKDYENFRQNVYPNLLFSRFVKNKSDVFVLENPKFEKYKENVEQMPLRNFALVKLKDAGFDVTLPMEKNPDDTINLYLLKTSRIKQALANESKGLGAKFGQIMDNLKARKFLTRFSHIASHFKSSNPFDYASFKFLKEFELNSLNSTHFNDFVNRFNVRDIEYVPRFNPNEYHPKN